MVDAPDGAPEVVLIASGSEVALAISACQALALEDIRARVVSMPSWELFERQPESYRQLVLPPRIRARIAIEQGSVLGWERYVGPMGRVIGMHTFGASAPLSALQTQFGFRPEGIVSTAKELLGAP
jgi:transketolase